MLGVRKDLAEPRNIFQIICIIHQKSERNTINS